MLLGRSSRNASLSTGAPFYLKLPADSTQLVDHPSSRDAYDKDGYRPYWTDIWPAARMLAKAVFRSTWPPGLTALEIGCGLGLPGIAALAKGFDVIFSDCDATALRFSADNARLNGFDRFRTMLLDWRFPPNDLQVPLILGADLLYELRNIEPLVQLVKKTMVPGGCCLLSDQDRLPASFMREALAEAGLVHTAEVVRAALRAANGPRERSIVSSTAGTRPMAAICPPGYHEYMQSNSLQSASLKRAYPGNARRISPGRPLLVACMLLLGAESPGVAKTRSTSRSSSTMAWSTSLTNTEVR